MLSIGAMRGGQQSYYLNLAREDYYLNGGEPPGLWHGSGAADLGLSGTVDGEALTRLFEGFHPREERALIQNAGSDKHQPGWDMTFSAPKSVSVLWSQASVEARRALQEAHLIAVKAGLDYLEEEIAVTRIGKGGAERESARLIVATFEHHTSRAQDPQLHTHALVMNVCTDAEGSTRTLESKSLYQAKMAAGAIYRAELAAQIETGLGLPVERRGSVFEIPGVSSALIALFSKRRAEIEEALAEKGYTSAAAAAIAALDTRHVKGHVAQEELLGEWQKVGTETEWGPDRAARLLATRQRPDHDVPSEREAALKRAADRATEQQSYFNRRDFTRYLAEEAPGRGLNAQTVRSGRDTFLASSPDVVRLGRHKGEWVYTTREMMQEEKMLLEAVEQSRRAESPGVSERTVAGIIATRPQFGQEQAAALRHITARGGNIRVVSGMAGTGKTTLLHAARLAWELEGFEVRGAALGGKAAEGLASGAGIGSETLKRTLWDIRNERLRLHEKSVLVLDEAGMVGTRMMRELLEAVEKAGARLVLVGDAQQLQPIEAGGPFAEIERRLGAARLTEIKRQREVWAREAVKDFAGGDAEQGLRAFAERGLLTIESDRHSAMESLIAAWKEQGIRHPEKQLILAGTRREASILNRMAQEERRKAGQIHGEGVAIPESNDQLYEGDRVVFLAKSRVYGVENSSQGSVVAADALRRALTVRLDKGELVHFSLDHYADVRPGYALTTHKGQGATTEWGFILAGGALQDRELSYVQVSRSRAETKIFTDAQEAGPDLTRLVRQMSQSRRKELAHEVQERPRPRPSPDIGF